MKPSERQPPRQQGAAQRWVESEHHPRRAVGSSVYKNNS